MTEQAEPSRRGIVTVVVVFGGLFVMFFVFAFVAIASMGEGFDLGGDRIGIVEVSGPILDPGKVTKNLRRYRDDESILGVVVRVDSPGGAVAPSQEIMQAIAQVGKRKPCAVSMGATAASGGYYIALGGSRIFANPGTVTGSIGVITQLFDVHSLLETVDVEVHTIKTGRFKDAGSPFRALTVEDEVHFRQLIDDIYNQFIEDIARARKLDVEKVRELADGRVFTGRQAKELNLIDELGSMDDAVRWVAEKAEIEGEPHLVYPPKQSSLVDDLIRGGVRSMVSETRESATPLVEYRYIGPQ